MQFKWDKLVKCWDTFERHRYDGDDVADFDTDVALDYDGDIFVLLMALMLSMMNIMLVMTIFLHLFLSYEKNNTGNSDKKYKKVIYLDSNQ